MSDQYTKTGAWMMVFAWIMLLAMLSFFFHQWLLYEEYASSQFTTRQTESGHIEVLLKANRHNHFVTQGQVNGKPVLFLLDTGATTISIPERIAKELKLKKGIGLRSETAAGSITVYHTVLDTVSIGPISLNKVEASINPHSKADYILLGMSFLKKLEFIYVKGQLILRQR